MILDCPPSLDCTDLNGLTAANDVIVPASVQDLGTPRRGAEVSARGVRCQQITSGLEPVGCVPTL